MNHVPVVEELFRNQQSLWKSNNELFKSNNDLFREFLEFKKSTGK